MTHSMTAFSRIAEHGNFGELIWEVRSVNHRYLEAFVKLPEDLRGIEPMVRDRIQQRLGRGKLDVGLRFKPSEADAGELRLNERLLEQVLGAAVSMQARLPGSASPAIMEVLRWPGVLQAGEQDMSEVQKAAMQLFDQALSDLLQARAREGQRMAELIVERVHALRAQVVKARELVPSIISAAQERIRQRVQEAAESVDESRLEQELVLLAQRLDVDEELDRLSTHLTEVEAVLKRKEPVGRRLDFLMQELNREANTLGSKSASAETTAVSVEMKVLIEQMREQVQNIE